VGCLPAAALMFLHGEGPHPYDYPCDGDRGLDRLSMMKLNGQKVGELSSQRLWSVGCPRKSTGPSGPMNQCGGAQRRGSPASGRFFGKPPRSPGQSLTA
jgi:hypothetical protein